MHINLGRGGPALDCNFWLYPKFYKHAISLGPSITMALFVLGMSINLSAIVLSLSIRGNNRLDK